MNTKLKAAIGVIGAGAMLLSATVIPALAQVNAVTGISVTATAAATTTPTGRIRMHLGANASGTVRANVIDQLVTRAGTEITNRINALNALETRINAMVKVSSDEKTALSTSIQAQITALTTLQGQITADQTANNTSSLKTDVQSITKAYRIYALIVPQGEIAAASDRILTITDAMTTLSGTLQTRITADQNAGVNMGTSVSALTDFNAKVADATTQANAAVNNTASLQPDNGDATVMTSNTAALKQARADIQVAQKDLVAARQDAMTIIAALKAAEKTTGTASATTTVTASATAQ